MKKVVSFKCLCILIILVSVFSISAFAVYQNVGLEFSEADEDQERDFVKNINLTHLKTEPKKEAIVCFNVSQSGLIAIGSDRRDTYRTVCVYSDNGEFLYGYGFESYKSFYVDFDDDQLIICFVSGDNALKLDDSGNVVDLMVIKDTSENNSYWRNVLNSTERDINGTIYALKNNAGIFNIFSMGSYAQLVISAADGEEVVFYNAGSSHIIKGILIFAFFVVFAIVAAYSAYSRMKSKKSSELISTN